ncbi:hypothetical protein ACLOJK_025624 [Asimina triloba]
MFTKSQDCLELLDRPVCSDSSQIACLSWLRGLRFGRPLPKGVRKPLKRKNYCCPLVAPLAIDSQRNGSFPGSASLLQPRELLKGVRKCQRRRNYSISSVASVAADSQRNSFPSDASVKVGNVIDDVWAVTTLQQKGKNCN